MGFLKTKGEIYKAVEDVDVGPNSNEFYLQANVKAPRMAGFLVKVFVWLLETPMFGSVMLYFLKRNNLIHKLVTFAELQESPLYVPLHNYEGEKEEENESEASPREQVRQALGCMGGTKPVYSFSRWTILDYSAAYNSKLITPTKVMERFLSAVEHSSTPSMQMSFFINFDAHDILRQAIDSTHRYQQGEPLSVLDGVPIAIKDEIDCMPYPTTGGTKWMHKVRECKDDAECVKRLRLCGAILVGKTNMHELGAGTSGINPHYGSTRNPYNIGRIAGGSSSGSAAVVAAGLCPAALGVDGGGSVRMPAALCGVVGFKPSFGRVSHSGVLPLNWTVGMVGILAGTVEDALLVYAAISGPKSSNHSETTQPKLCFPMLKSPKPVPNIRLAKYGEWFNDCSDEIRVCCCQALAKLHDNYGWETIQVTIPEIEVMRLAHYVTIGSECSTSIAPQLQKLNKEELGWDARVALSVYGSFSSQDYLNAQRIRNRQLQLHKKIFSKADVIVTPTTGVTATTRITQPPSTTKSKVEIDVDLQDVLAAAQAAADSAERAAAAARSAASLAQVRISELTRKRSEEVPVSPSENPFYAEKQESHILEKPHLDLQRQSSNSDGIPSPLHGSPLEHQVSNIPSYDDSTVGVESPISHIHHPGQGLHQPQRLPSMDDETYYSYPNLFNATNGSNPSSRSQSFKDTNIRSSHDK